MFTVINKDKTVVVRISSENYKKYEDAKHLISEVNGKFMEASLERFGRCGGEQTIEIVKTEEYVDTVFHYPHTYSDF